MANAIARGVKTVVKAPGAVIGFTSATVLGATGGIVKATGQGLVAGVKGASKLKTKMLGEAAEVAAKGGDDVANSVNKSTNELTRQQASNMWSFKDENGRHYYRQVQTKAKVDADGNIIKDADGNVIREKIGTKYYIDSSIGRQNINGVEYGNARRKWLNSLPNETVDASQIDDIIQETSESGAGWWDGIPGWAKTASVATAGAVAGAVLFDDDE